MAPFDCISDTSPPLLCPRSSMRIQLPCDEQSFNLEFECETHSLLDLAQSRYDNTGTLGGTAYLIRLFDLREQIQTLRHQCRDNPILESDQFHRLEVELLDMTNSLPPEMQDSERAVYIRCNTPESSVFIMVLSWLHTCWVELMSIFAHAGPESTSTLTPDGDDQQHLLTHCRRELVQHAISLNKFWFRVHETQELSPQRFFVTDINIAYCAYMNVQALVQPWCASLDPPLITAQRVQEALRLDISIVRSLENVSEYASHWGTKIIQVIAGSDAAEILTCEEHAKLSELDSSAEGSHHLNMEDELAQRRKHEDSRFPRRSGFRPPGDPSWTVRSRTSRQVNRVATSSQNAPLPLASRGLGSSPQPLSVPDLTIDPPGLPLPHLPHLGVVGTLPTHGDAGDGSTFSQVGWSPVSDSMIAFYAQELTVMTNTIHSQLRNPFAIREDPINPLPREVYGWRIYALAASAAWASAMFGYDMSFIGSTMALPSFQEAFGLDGSAKTELSSRITSTFQAGCFFGAILGFIVGEMLGRKWNLISSGVVFGVGAAMQTESRGMLGLMYAGRALTGIGVGASSLIVPIYIAESAPATIRGRLIGVFEVMLQLASVFGFWITYGVNQNLPPGTKQWTIPFAVQLIPAGLLIVCMIFMPESPRWLIKRGRREQAVKNLCWVRNLPADDPYVVQELADMEAQLEAEAASQGTGISGMKLAWKEMTRKEMRFRIIFAMAMKWMSNLTGTNALNYFTPVIFESIGFEGTSTMLLATGVYGLVKAAVTLVFIFWAVDTWGRRKALITGSLIIFFCFFYLGTYSKLSRSFDGGAERDGGAYAAIVLIYLYAAAFAMSWNAMPWIFAAEVFPTRIRTLGMLISVLNQWLAQFIVHLHIGSSCLYLDA
ncbi:hypothetical protein NM208_g14093 [Fusarium decemcellulare]|uniref:Uncharacterized protein n=1 Tax=Fusarium decemcellulare TaxID=57161 RepID=A0ACC1RJZ1_9HYPO|nr:hypothetical protein NM208_g14093 [Fusarium decemcellulare]